MSPFRGWVFLCFFFYFLSFFSLVMVLCYLSGSPLLPEEFPHFLSFFYLSAVLLSEVCVAFRNDFTFA